MYWLADLHCDTIFWQRHLVDLSSDFFNFPNDDLDLLEPTAPPLKMQRPWGCSPAGSCCFSMLRSRLRDFPPKSDVSRFFNQSMVRFRFRYSHFKRVRIWTEQNTEHWFLLGRGKLFLVEEGRGKTKHFCIPKGVPELSTKHYFWTVQEKMTGSGPESAQNCSRGENEWKTESISAHFSFCSEALVSVATAIRFGFGFGWLESPACSVCYFSLVVVVGVIEAKYGEA